MKNIASVYETLNIMKAQEVIGDYAVGGAVATLFYAEATRTFDLDIFAVLPVSGSLISLTSVFNWCEKQGFNIESEHAMIHGVPVQFLAANEGLEHESLKNARVFDYENISLKVIAPEYLIALYLKAGGAKRKARVAALNEAGCVNKELLQGIFNKFNLSISLLPDELR